MNRKERRAKQSLFNRQLKNAEFDNFEDITTPLATEKFSKIIKNGVFLGFVKNSIYSVQIYKKEDCFILGIRRHDQKPICPWSHRQKIKDHVLGEDAVAVEYMPPDHDLVDQANMFWLFSSPEIVLAYEKMNLKKIGK